LQNMNWCSHLSSMDRPHGPCSDCSSRLGKHNDWTPHDKAVYLTTALYEPVFRILHGISTRPMYEEVTRHLGSIQWPPPGRSYAHPAEEKNPVRQGIPVGRSCPCTRQLGKGARYKTTVTLGAQEENRLGPWAGGSWHSNQFTPQGLTHDREVQEGPVPVNGMERQPTAYVLVLWKHLPSSKRLPQQIGQRRRLAVETYQWMRPDCSSRLCI
jgi:hypothetical protein